MYFFQSKVRCFSDRPRIIAIQILIFIRFCLSRPEKANLLTFERNWASVWVKMISSWTCIGIYLLTLFTPELCPGRLDRSRVARTEDFEMA